MNHFSIAHRGRSTLTAFIALIAVAAAALGIVPTAGAATGTLSYSCSGDGFGEPGTAYTFQAVVDSDLPATLPFGSTTSTTWTTQVVAPESFGAWARSRGFTTLYASVDVGTARDGVAQEDLGQSTAGMAVPASGAWTWNPNPRTTQVVAGTLGRHSYTVTSLELFVAFHDASGPRWATSATCALNPAVPLADSVVDVFDVVAAPTSTVLKVAGSTATATVTAQGVVPAGTVTFSAGGQSVSTEVRSGTASAKLPSLAPGTYTASAVFVPSDPSTQASSVGTATYAVPRIRTTASGLSARVSDSGVMRVRARVVARDQSDVTGRMTFSVKRNGRTIDNATVSLLRGDVAKTKFRGVTRAGRYVVMASYLGNNTFESSRTRLRFRLR